MKSAGALPPSETGLRHLVDTHTSGRGFLIKKALPEALRKKPSHQEGSPEARAASFLGFSHVVPVKNTPWASSTCAEQFAVLRWAVVVFLRFCGCLLIHG
jgi:hypothetical protein